MAEETRDRDLEETKRVIEPLVRTPPKPHRAKGGSRPVPRSGKSPEKRPRSKKSTGGALAALALCALAGLILPLAMNDQLCPAAVADQNLQAAVRASRAAVSGDKQERRR